MSSKTNSILLQSETILLSFINILKREVEWQEISWPRVQIQSTELEF